MGGGASAAAAGGQEVVISTRSNRDIDRQLEADFINESKKIKLLLLGAGESGKSTIFKQMKLLYGVKYTDAERQDFIQLIHTNVLNATKTLCEQVVARGLEGSLGDGGAFSLINGIDADSDSVLSPARATAIKTLWSDPVFQSVWEVRSEFQMPESLNYYFDKIDDLAADGYLPSDDDILRSRMRTTGIVVENYFINGRPFEMYDVGGQRSERKKWIHCFEGVTAVIFVAAVSEYDQKLFEDGATNRMTEALTLFEEIAKNPFFSKSSLILFLNKYDLFEAKIASKNIRDQPDFRDYKGANGDVEAGYEYFLNKFEKKSFPTADRKLYTHRTCATDSKNVSVVFNACTEIILKNKMKDTGFMD